jgi:hypothetical protein
MDKFGTLRKLRTSLFGAPKIPEDPFGHSRHELTKYRTVIAAMSRTIDRFEKEIHSMYDVHEKLSVELKSFEFRNSLHIKRFSEALDSMTSNLSLFEVAELRAKVHEVTLQLDALHSLIDKRDAALAEKVHFDKKIAKLSDDKKKDRNDVKHDSAIRLYAELDERVQNETQAILDKREQVIQDLVLDYMQAYQRLFKNLNETFSKASMIRATRSASFKPSGSVAPSAPVLEDSFNYS